MAVEQKRGCGYRKVGGLYLVGGGIGVPCDRLPLALDICPCCGGGIKQTRSWTWVNVGMLVQGPHMKKVHGPHGGDTIGIPCKEARDQSCTFCAAPELMGRAGLLWIGEQFYSTPFDFVAEGAAQGFSRRIGTMPRNFEPGKTWVLLAHPKAVPTEVPVDTQELLPGAVPTTEVVMKPGVFYVWRPEHLEKICKESTRGTVEIAALEKRGIVPVFVPDDDPDHQGTAYDKEEQLGPLFTEVKG